VRRIIAIGGGEIGRPGYPVETTEIDQEIVRLTGKARPKVLLIPTASGDSEVYIEAFNNHFGQTLGCKTDTMCLITDKSLSAQAIQDKVLGSDAVYVGGGNTAKMLRLWRKLGVDQVLGQALSQGVVLSGLSAGAICWFRYGRSDSRMSIDPQAGLIRVSGLGFVHATACPHYDVEPDREQHLRQLMHRTPGVAIALQNCCALEIIDDTYRIITSKPDARAYRIFSSAGTSYREMIPCDANYRPLMDLLSKSVHVDIPRLPD